MKIFDPQSGLTTLLEADDSSRRRWGRLAQEGVYSNFGQVYDLSAGGMRIMTARLPKGRFDIEIFSATQGVRLQGEVSWVQRRGFFRKEVGIRFVGVSAELAEVLTAMATMNRYRRSICNSNSSESSQSA